MNDFKIEKDIVDVPLPEKRHKYHEVIEFAKTIEIEESFTLKGEQAFESGIRKALREKIDNKEFVVRCIDEVHGVFRALDRDWETITS